MSLCLSLSLALYVSVSVSVKTLLFHIASRYKTGIMTDAPKEFDRSFCSTEYRVYRPQAHHLSASVRFSRNSGRSGNTKC